MHASKAPACLPSRKETAKAPLWTNSMARDSVEIRLHVWSALPLYFRNDSKHGRNRKCLEPGHRTVCTIFANKYNKKHVRKQSTLDRGTALPSSVYSLIVVMVKGHQKFGIVLRTMHVKLGDQRLPSLESRACCHRYQ